MPFPRLGSINIGVEMDFQSGILINLKFLTLGSLDDKAPSPTIELI